MANGNKPTPEERSAWLVEYQMCQHHSDSLGLQYWTLAGIFIGFTSALLGGIIYGIISNKVLLNLILYQKQDSRELILIGLILWVIGTAMLIIIFFLKGWLKRANHLMNLNYKRMREIEIFLGMEKVWLADTIDMKHKCENWEKEIEKSPACEQQKKSLIERINRFINRYNNQIDKRWERPTSTWHHRWIFGTLFVLWLFVLAGGFALLYFFHCIAIIITLIITFAIWFIILKRKQSQGCFSSEERKA